MKSLFSRETFDLWMDAFYFHKDSKKQDALRDLIKPMGLPHATFHWLWFLEEQARAILGLANLVVFILNPDDESHELKVSFKR